MPDSTVIFSAPQGWGKGLRAKQLLQEFGCTHVANDDWCTGDPVQPGALHLTSSSPAQLGAKDGEILTLRAAYTKNQTQVTFIARGWPAAALARQREAEPRRTA